MSDSYSESAFGDESLLIQELMLGSPRAIDQIVERYSKPLFAFIVRMVEDEAVAEDIYQDTWIRVIRSVGSFRGESRFSTWLFQIALNLCRNLMRQKARRQFVPLEEALDVGEEPEVDAGQIIQARKVRQLVASLPVKMREMVVLRYYHDYTDAEIAEITGYPLGTVKSRLHRATGLLRAKLEVTGQTATNAEVD